MQQNVTLRFYTLAHIKHGGFLIKYSVLPLSNNATIRLQCYVAPAVSRAPVATNHPAMNLPPQPSEQIPHLTNEMTIPVEQRTSGENSPSPPLDIIHSNDLIKRFPSGHDVIPPILGTLEEHKVCVDLNVIARKKRKKKEIIVWDFFFFNRIIHH